MVEDAKFEDGGERPLRLLAMDADDLQVVSALTQDAVFPITEMTWQKRRRRFALLLNRLRWEDTERATAPGRQVERVQSVLTFGDIEKVQTSGVNRAEKDMVLSLLSIAFESADDGTGRVLLTLAGDGAIALDVEALEVTLEDVTRPYVAPSHHTPHHPED